MRLEFQNIQTADLMDEPSVGVQLRFECKITAKVVAFKLCFGCSPEDVAKKLRDAAGIIESLGEATKAEQERSDGDASGTRGNK